MLRAAFYAPFAIRHHWTPEQVDRIPAEILPYVLPVENVLREFMDEEAKRRARHG